MDEFSELKKEIEKERKTIRELGFLFANLEKIGNVKEKEMISSQIISLRNLLKKTNDGVYKLLEKISITRPLPTSKQFDEEQKIQMPEKKSAERKYEFGFQSSPSLDIMNNNQKKISEGEKETLRRIKKREIRIKRKKIKKPSKYLELANKIFFENSSSIVKNKIFPELESDLTKAGFQITPASYISVLLLTTLLSVIAGFFLFLFFLFFNIGISANVITLVKENFEVRFLKVFWILFAVPVATFLIAYLYPTMEKKSIEGQINQELPFATIHMAAISGSMIEPSKIFNIIIETKEYPSLRKEFIRLTNKINIYGYDLITALKNSAINSPSKKLSELFNGLAVAINSGGGLVEFFNKKSQSLLFEYRLDKEKYTKLAETFMDIYISVVIAAPMILMLLLIMMKVGGLGITLSTSMITLMMILGVAAINIFFIVFLHIKQPTE